MIVHILSTDEIKKKTRGFLRIEISRQALYRKDQELPSKAGNLAALSFLDPYR